MTALQRLQDEGAMPLVRDLAIRHRIAMERLLDTKVHEPRVVRARHELWCVVRDTLGLGYAETARLFGADHTSIIHADRKRQAQLRSLFLRPGVHPGLDGGGT